MGTCSSKNSTDVVHAVVSVQARKSFSNKSVKKADSSSIAFPTPPPTQQVPDHLVKKSDSSSRAPPTPPPTQKVLDHLVEKSDSSSRASPTPPPIQQFPDHPVKKSVSFLSASPTPPPTQKVPDQHVEKLDLSANASPTTLPTPYNQILKANEDSSLKRALSLPVVSSRQLVCSDTKKPAEHVFSKEDSDITHSYDGKLSPLVVDPDPIENNPNHSEEACQELVSALVSIDKEVREKVQTILTNWEESEIMSTINDHAQSASNQTIDGDLSKLALYLTDDLGYSDLAKAFAIYIWICTNISINKSIRTKYETKYTDHESYIEAQHVLKYESSNYVGYSILFVELAKLAGIRAKVIRGEISHVPTPALPADEARKSTAIAHTWNAVKLDEVWFPVDCTFGANYFDKSMEARYNYIRHFFAATPSTFILTHWPNKKKWQLLETPVEREALDPLVILPSCAAGRGIRPLTWRRSIIVSDENQHSTVVKLTAHPSLRIGVKLQYMNMKTFNYEEVTSKNLICVQRDEDAVCIRAALPFKGSYSLLLTVNREKRRGSRVPQVFLSYNICVTHMSEPLQQIGYPKVYQMAASAYNFQLLFWNQSSHDYICESDSEQLNLAFKAKRKMTCLHFLVPGKTQQTRPKDHSVVYNYNSMVVTETDGADSDQGLHMLKVIFPAEGWWTICLNGTKGNPNFQSLAPYVTLLSYQVYAHRGDSTSTFPYIISPQVSVCYFDSISSVSESIDIPFTTTKPLEFQAYLMENIPNAPELESYVQIKQAELSSNQYRLTAMFPKPGQWHVHVFACPEEDDEDNETVRGLFSLLVNVETPMQGAVSVALSLTIAEKIQLYFPNKGYISFPDIGKPLTIDFECDKNTSFQHRVFPEDQDEKTSKEYNGLSLFTHCTYLTPLNRPGLPSSFRPILLSRRSITQPVLPTHLCEIISYQLHASFPWPGKWTVKVFAQAPGSSDYSLAFHVTMKVTKPSRGICYPFIYEEFIQLGIRIPIESICYNPICSESTQFELPFIAPDDLQYTWNIEVAGSDSCYKKQGFVYISGNALAGPPNNHFQLSFSTSGIWRAVLFAKKSTPKDSILEEDSYKPVLEISLLVNTVDKDVAFPEIYPAFKKYGLSIAKMNIPFLSRVQNSVQNTSTTVIVSLFSLYPGNVQFYCRVKCAEKTEEENRLLLLRSQMLEDTYSGLNEIRVDISEPGTYKIQLGAKWRDCKEYKYEPVLTHIVSSI